eukprot:359116-Chlamydomonas_euryale.AAC.13
MVCFQGCCCLPCCCAWRCAGTCMAEAPDPRLFWCSCDASNGAGLTSVLPRLKRPQTALCDGVKKTLVCRRYVTTEQRGCASPGDTGRCRGPGAGDPGGVSRGEPRLPGRGIGGKGACPRRPLGLPSMFPTLPPELPGCHIAELSADAIAAAPMPPAPTPLRMPGGVSRDASGASVERSPTGSAAIPFASDSYRGTAVVALLLSAGDVRGGSAGGSACCMPKVPPPLLSCVLSMPPPPLPCVLPCAPPPRTSRSGAPRISRAASVTHRSSGTFPAAFRTPAAGSRLAPMATSVSSTASWLAAAARWIGELPSKVAADSDALREASAERAATRPLNAARCTGVQPLRLGESSGEPCRSSSSIICSRHVREGRGEGQTGVSGAGCVCEVQCEAAQER